MNRNTIVRKRKMHRKLMAVEKAQKVAARRHKRTAARLECESASNFDPTHAEH